MTGDQSPAAKRFVVAIRLSATCFVDQIVDLFLVVVVCRQEMASVTSARCRVQVSNVGLGWLCDIIDKYSHVGYFVQRGLKWRKEI